MRAAVKVEGGLLSPVAAEISPAGGPDTDEDRPMTHVKYVCDRCHREITADRAMLAIKTGSQRDFIDSDLCPGCAQALRSWLATPAEGEPPPPRPYNAP